MTELHEISFWAHQFSEHCQLMKTLIEKNHVFTDESGTLNNLEERWNQIHEQPESFDENSDLIGETRSIKGYVEGKFDEEGIECLPDLIAHMIEELDYFENAIVNETYTPLEEMQWWAREHAENLDFANCELPILIKEDGIAPVPQKAEEMKKKNEQLSQKFKDIATKIGQQLANEEENGVPEDLYNELFDLKVEHLNGLTEAIDSLPDLPLSDETKQMVHEMLHHESAEADFAFNRLGKVTGFE